MKDNLLILWTNADPNTAEMMVFMYAKNAKINKWWDDITIIVWGATAKLVAENKNIQEKLLELKSIGVEVSFCISCATKLGVVDQIKELGLELKAWGIPLTTFIKNDAKILTI